MRTFRITVNGTAYDVKVEELSGAGDNGAAQKPLSFVPVEAASPPPVPQVEAPVAAPPVPPVAPTTEPVPAKTVQAKISIEALMPGIVLDIFVQPGQPVSAGDILLTMESMNVQHNIVAPSAGTVSGVHVKRRDVVNTGAMLISMG